MNKNIVMLGLRGINGRFVEASDNYIAELEKQCGFRLSDHYREFLKKFGASLFTENSEFRPLVPSPWAVNGMEAFDVFYGMSENSSFDLQKVNSMLRGSVIDQGIAIGNDPGANLIILDPNGDVYFYDNETGQKYLAARDFNSFLDSFEKTK